MYRCARAFAVSAPGWHPQSWRLFTLLGLMAALVATTQGPWSVELRGAEGDAVPPALRPLTGLAPDWAGLTNTPAGMVWIAPGRFKMGSSPDDRERQPDDVQHDVLFTRGFWIGRHEVTQAEYTAVIGINPSDFKGTNLPVERVSWTDATNYCARLTARERAAGRIPGSCEYRLPTEAQWEYACRAGTTGPTAFGKSLDSRQANFDGTYPYAGAAIGPNLERTTPVGTYAPNAWNICDMHGNVWEWCADWYGDYAPGTTQDPTGPASGFQRVFRGGSWGDVGSLCRTSYRNRGVPGTRVRNLGFRVVLVRE